MDTISKLSSLHQWSFEKDSSDKLPVLFLGHGSPMNAISDNEFVRSFSKLGETIEMPRAILCISAHWMTEGSWVTAMEHPKTIHDFGGFPKELYEVQYPALGDPALADYLSSTIKDTDIHKDTHWGLDHGAWSVIIHLYPKADVPIIQLSIDMTKPAQYHYELAKQLYFLRRKGVLIIGSGNIVHNLRMLDWEKSEQTGYGYDWALEVRNDVNNALLNSNHQKLIDYKKQGSAFQLAVPTPEHYLPLIYCIALQDKQDNIAIFNDKALLGSLTMTSVKFA